jgi:hypothetical protein
MRAVRGTGGLVGPRSHGGGGSDHPLLQLQRQAGNRATTLWVQRDDKEAKPDPMDYVSSKVAIARMESVYDGRLNADIDAASLTRIWDPGLLASDRFIKLNAGPVTFSWRSAQTRIFADTFPWGMSLATKGSAFVVEEVGDALDTIYARWEKEDAKFWAAVATLKSRLKTDIEAWRAYRKKYPRRSWWGSSED